MPNRLLEAKAIRPSLPPRDLEGRTIAAVDLGSNSFHMLIARVDQGQIAVLDRLREMVRMAGGLTTDGRLTPAVRERSLRCLAKFGERLRSLDPAWVRAVATNTVRQLHNPQSFLLPAETALGSPIEVVSGREEARMIYLGVAHAQAEQEGRRLVVDIGGGSTELIIGEGFDALERESTQMGCVASTRRFFADGKVGPKRWETARAALELELAPSAQTFRKLGWRRAYGASGTMKAIAGVLEERGGPAGVIRLQDLQALIRHALSVGQLDQMQLPGLNEDRRAVFLGGLCVLAAVFTQLNLDVLKVSEYAMREGILYDLIGRSRHKDPREGSVKKLAKRYGIDKAQEKRVWKTLTRLFEQIAEPWALTEADRETLSFATRLHEVGLAIAHSQHHQHGAYIVRHTDLPGFSRQEQERIALLVGLHRRSLGQSPLAQLDEQDRQHFARLLVLLRLAILLNRTRAADAADAFQLRASRKGLTLRLDAGWLAARPLTRADMLQERDFLKPLGIALKVTSKRKESVGQG
ncbi:MAG: Ppx/GppA family phosphatase [Xanthomonadales bacterium]|nr:Ppx/GppA family phosphatase [Xanthomonadales bacterium]